MRGRTITIEVVEKRGKAAKTIPLYQYDYGQKLLITGVELPEYYEVHFSNTMNGEATTVLGDSTGVLIPDSLVATGEPIYLWLYLHDTSYDGETEYYGVIPVIKRAQPTDITPTPEEQSIITQVIAALNNMEDDMSEQVAEATAAKEAAEAAESTIEGYATSASNAADAAGSAQTSAEAAQTAAEAAQSAAETAAANAGSAYNNADTARADAVTAKEAAEAAQTAAESASSSAVSANANAQSAASSAEDYKDAALAAQGAAETAQGLAETAQAAAEAAEDGAEAKALVSEGYALGTQDGVSVEAGSTYYHNNAAYFADQAGDAQTAAETAQTAAEAAQTAAETAAGHYPKIDETSKNWLVWDSDESDYVDTEVCSEGKDGQDGTDGTDGQDGYTPVRGLDYWTAEDKAEIVSDVEGEIVDDTAGEGDTNKTWSADKLSDEFGGVLNDIGEQSELLDDAVYWEENQDDDTIEGIIESEIKDNMTFGLSGTTLSIKYKGDTVCSVQLPTAQPIPCTGVALDLSVATVETEKTVTLTATLTPNNTTDSVTWGSSNDAIASVTNGVVTGVAKGTATITVTCGSFSDTCTVTVTAYFRDLVLGYVLPQSNRLDYRSSYGYKSGGTFNDPFLKKIASGQKVSLKYTPNIISGLYVYMYVYSSGTFTDKCSKVGDDYVLTQAMLDMQSNDTYGILVSSERLSSYGAYASQWAGDYTASQDCFVAFFYNINGSADISNNLDTIKQAIRIEVE